MRVMICDQVRPTEKNVRATKCSVFSEREKNHIADMLTRCAVFVCPHHCHYLSLMEVHWLKTHTTLANVRSWCSCPTPSRIPRVVVHMGASKCSTETDCIGLVVVWRFLLQHLMAGSHLCFCFCFFFKCHERDPHAHMRRHVGERKSTLK